MSGACLHTDPPNADVGEQVFFDMVQRGLRVKRVKALLKKVLGNQRHAQMLRTLKPMSGQLFA